MNIRPLGLSDRLFYYMNAGEQMAFDLWTRIDLNDTLDRATLTRAIKQALLHFPEFAFRPVWHDGGVWAAENNAPVPLLDDDNRPLYYGTDDTGGYVFAILCRENGFSVSNFHGLSDFHGVWCFTRTILYYYAKEKGLPVTPDSFVRTSADDASVMDEEERLNPYAKFALHTEASSADHPMPEALALPKVENAPETDRYEHCIEIALSRLLEATHQMGTSVAPLLCCLAARSLAAHYGAGDKPIIAMLPSDMRKYYGCNTMVNFSDATFINYDISAGQLSIGEHAAMLRHQLREQMGREHFDPLITAKANMVEQLTKSGVDVTEWNRRFSHYDPETTKLPFSFPLTYPGSLNLPEGYTPLVKQITRHLYVLAGLPFGATSSSYGDTLCIRSCESAEQSPVMQGILQLLNELDIPATLKSGRRYSGRRIVVERLIKA